nr:hypothetical protein [Acidimicrobiia bacterium]
MAGARASLLFFAALAVMAGGIGAALAWQPAVLTEGDQGVVSALYDRLQPTPARDGLPADAKLDLPPALLPPVVAEVAPAPTAPPT